MGMGVAGFKVKCRTCGCTDLYETTEHYNCHKPLTGDMLRLTHLYKDWPTYDGSLAVKSTSRFLMFCSKCAGNISTTGKLDFVDFPDLKVTEISEERQKLVWSGESDLSESEPIDDMVISEKNLRNIRYRKFCLSDDPRKVEPLKLPDDLMREIEKDALFSLEKGISYASNE